MDMNRMWLSCGIREHPLFCRAQVLAWHQHGLDRIGVR